MTEHELATVLKASRHYWLSGWYTLNDTENALRECNGMGAEWFPSWVRKFLDYFLRLFAPAVAIHDMRYFRQEPDRRRWDDEFEYNCRTILDNYFGWYNPLLYIGRWIAHKLRLALTVGGELAWRKCQKGGEE